MAEKIPFPEHLLNQTPATIWDAWEKAGESGPKYVTTGDLGSVNLSSIATKLIQECGRFAESYASDMLITWAHVEELCSSRYDLKQEIDEIYCFGIRKMGVDHNAYIINRLKETMAGGDFVHHDRVYRKTLAVRVHVYAVSEWDEVTVELKDISSNLYKINPADMAEL